MRINVTCKKCHKPFSISDGQQKWLKDHGLDNFTMCKACRDARKKMIPIVCRDCGATFTISGGEADWYKEHSLEFPVHCKACRDKRRSAAIKEAADKLEEGVGNSEQ